MALNNMDATQAHELFRKNHNKAADLNLPLLAEAIAVRDEIAEVLGYDSWAAYVLEIKMAKTPAAVDDFLVDLQAKVEVKAGIDIGRLTASKRAESGDADATLELWDFVARSSEPVSVRFHAQAQIEDGNLLDLSRSCTQGRASPSVRRVFLLYKLKRALV